MKKLLAVVLAAVTCLGFAGCGKKSENKTIKVGATPAPHAEILEVCKDVLKEKGYDLEIVEFTDYVQPNTATESGDIDANYFQHITYLKDFNEEQKTHLVSVAAIHYEPFGIYAGKTKSLADIKDGAKVAVPNDTTNEARALLLLEEQGLIKLADGAGITATKLDIVENTKNIEIVEMEAAQLPRTLDSVDVAVINGNYAIEAGLKVSDALAVEDPNGTAAEAYANVLVVKEGNEKNEGILALIDALKSDEVKKFITEKYDGAVVALF